MRQNWTKMDVLECAAALAEAEGLDRLTVQSLSAALEIKPASLYNHVESMDALRRALALKAMQELAAFFQEAAVGVAGEDALKAMAGAYRAYAQEHPQLYKAFVQYGAADGGPMQAEGERIMHLIFHVVEPAGGDEETLRHFGRMFRSALHGFVSLEAAGYFAGAPDKEKSYRLLVETLITAWEGMRDGEK